MDVEKTLEYALLATWIVAGIVFALAWGCIAYNWLCPPPVVG